ncbi:MAG: hypothetical protein KDK78_07595, partial [Chlamydiia bacterium]|nr:hypothetical protein [Chlamydiia bacterium]
VNLEQELRELSDSLQQSRKDLEMVLRRELMAAYPDPKAVTALQKAAIEKEVEGVATMRQLDAVNGMLDVLMTWFRDAHLLRSNGDRGLVYNLDCLSELEQAARSPQLPSMDRVEKAVEEMQLALARSSPLPASLEALCLKLDMSG